MYGLDVLIAAVNVQAVALGASRSATAPSPGDPIKRLAHGVSTNWAGYSAHPGTFTQVSAQWTEPAVACGAGETSYSSAWAGIDGDGSATVEQTGTDADCSNGTPTYYAWYEMYPKYPVTINHTVSPGDQLSASVTTSGSGTFTLSIADSTQGWAFTTNQRIRHAQLLSAEVIVEAPSSRSGVLPLADFVTVNISSAMANGRAIGAFNPEELTMVTSGGIVKAQPSALSGGTSFSVDWKHS